MKLLYVPNEDGDFRQVGFRRPLANLLETSLLDAVSVFSLQWRIRNGGDPEQHRADLVERVRQFQPDMVLMQHIGATHLREKHFLRMRQAADFKLIYHEADPYSPILHPLPLAARAAGKFADVVFTVGSGWFSRNFLRTGATDVRWASHVFETERYPRTPVPTSENRTHDIVMVANRNRPRLRGLPNWKDRIRFVEYMQDRFGDRFAIYGHGWSGPSAMGPVAFDKQNETIRSAWISANWDHYSNEPAYFSNRLPVSLSVGSIHATGWHPGYDTIFGEETRQFLVTAKRQDALADQIDGLLSSTTPAERIQAGVRGQEYAFTHFRQDDQLVRFLNFEHEVVNPASASVSWNTSTPPLSEL